MSASDSHHSLSPARLDAFFAPEHQQTYIALLIGRGGLTRIRASYFVRLWAYLLLKHLQAQGSLQPLTQLDPPDAMVPCTHREAAELFYGNQERGSDRAAGLMIDRLADLGLLDKQFDGQTLCLQIRVIPELMLFTARSETVDLVADEFNPRTDAIPIANMITRSYAELVKDSAYTSHKISRTLRLWSSQYAKCLRVLRRSDNLNPVGIAILYPVAQESEYYFFQSPSKSFYMTTEAMVDVFTMAQVGDPNCTAVFVRSWVIDPTFLQSHTLQLFQEDTQQLLRNMQQDFPNLCDMYSLVIQPLHEEFRKALGFYKICQDTQRPYSWVYLSLDRYLAVDMQQVVASLMLP